MSKREKLFRFMLDGKEKTSLQIDRTINTVCAGTMAADLRKKGCHVVSRYIGRSKTGAQIHGYILLSFPEGLYGVGR